MADSLVPLTDKYLIVKGSSGMGNRINAFMGGLVYSKITNRKLIVDWRGDRYSTQEINAFHEYFSCPFIDPALKIPESSSVFPEIWRDHLNYQLRDIQKKFGPEKTLPDWTNILKQMYSFDLSNINHEEQVLVMFDYAFAYTKNLSKHASLLPVEWPTRTAESLLQYLLKNYLFLKPSIQAEVDEFAKKNFVGSVIGVHIRYTDNLKDGKLIPLGEYPKKLDKLLAENPNATIFLSTDNEDVYKILKEKYPSVISTNKFYSNKNGEPVAIHSGYGCKDKLQMGKEALIDMFLLSKCDYLVYSSVSSFVRLSILLSNFKKDHLFDVGRLPYQAPISQSPQDNMASRNDGYGIISKLKKSFDNALK
jgi:hypothetical protein